VTGGGTPSTPPYSFVPAVPPATEDRFYSIQAVQNCDGNNCELFGVRVAIISGALPAGMTFGNDGVLRGLPFITGT
jgi:hypothetical protein